MPRRFVLTKAAKRRMAWNFRTNLEREGLLPSDAVRHLQQFPRYSVLVDRWSQRVIGRGLLAAQSEDSLLTYLRTLYCAVFGKLPSQPLKPKAGVTPTHTLAMPQQNQGQNQGNSQGQNQGDSQGDSQGNSQGDSQGDSASGTPTDSASGTPTDSDSDGEGFERREGTSGGGQFTGETERIQTDWSGSEKDAEQRVKNALNQRSRKLNASPFQRWDKPVHAKLIASKLAQSRQLAGKLRRALQTDARTRVSRFKDAGEIDMKRLPDIAQLNDISNVYQRVTQGRKLDACVQIYIDESHSMNARFDCPTKGQKKGDSRMAVAAATAAVLSTVFDQLRIPHQLIVFSEETRVIKNWRGKWKQSQLESIKHSESTNAPDSLRVGLPQMAERRERRKVAVMITDGDMSTVDKFWSIGGEFEKWKKQHGVELYAVGLGTSVLRNTDNDRRLKQVKHGRDQTPIGCGKRVEVINHTGDVVLTRCGVDGGVDNVNDKELIPKLTKHLACVFTEGREAVQ